MGAAWSTLYGPIQRGVETVVLCGRPSRLAAECTTTHSIDSATLVSRIYFMWASPLIAKAASGSVQLADLWRAHPAIEVRHARDELAACWQAERVAAATAGRPPALRTAMWRSVRGAVGTTFAFKMGWLLFAMVSNALLLSYLIRFMQTPSQPVWVGYVLALSFLLSEACRSIFVNQHWLVAVLAGIRLRAAARGLLYDKLLRLRGDALESVGPAVNLLTADAQRLCDACSYGEFILSTGPTLAATLGVMLALLGPAALAGMGVLLLFVPLQAWVGGLVGDVRRVTVRFTDERARMMSEVLANVKAVKLNSWEAAFADRVAGVRAAEVASLTRGALLRAVNTVVVFCVPALTTLAAFAAYVLASGQQIGPIPTFVTLSLFNVARFSLGLLPQAVRNVQEAGVAAARMQVFLSLPEVAPGDCPIQLPDNDSRAPPTTTSRAVATEETAAPPLSDVIVLDADSEPAAADTAAPAATGSLSSSASVLDGSTPATEGSASALLAAYIGDGGLPPPDVVVFARNASFEWPSPPPREGRRVCVGVLASAGRSRRGGGRHRG